MRPESDSATIADAIEALLAARRAEASICPSEVARSLAPEDWRALMPAVRECALELARLGRLRITQRGHTLNSERLPKGPIRLAKV